MLMSVAPTVKHLFLGFDVTIFAYGATGTGKTHTMKGGRSLADRGMIPRFLSGIYRKSRALEKGSDDTTVEVSMSYYEIYNDRVFDLFDAPEQRTTTGLPIREAEGGKTVVVGLTEVPCATLKEFEILYDRANANRSTGATKLNALSSRSHAILCVKLTVSTPTETRISTASAIDLAGSEDNRRTGNGKERMVESASINKSLFVLAQCVEAISKKQSRIPYRESKMTRILSLGQNNGFTVMILNLAPVASYHLDTLSSLNFANRTKKIEIREVENEPIFKGPPRQPAGTTSITGPTIQRQPLRPLANAANIKIVSQKSDKPGEKPLKAFSVYSDRHPSSRPSHPPQKSPLKRPADSSFMSSVRPNKTARPTPSFLRRGPEPQTLTKQTIESLVEKKVSEILASRSLDAPAPYSNSTKDPEVSEEVQKRLANIEQRLAGQEGERAEGLSYLFMAKQHQARGEDGSALKMYELAQPYFPDNEKLARKIEGLREKIKVKREEQQHGQRHAAASTGRSHRREEEEGGGDAEDESAAHADEDQYAPSRSEDEDDDDDDQPIRPRKQTKPRPRQRNRASSPDPLVDAADAETSMTPRTQRLLCIINTRDVARIKALNGVGVKRAEGIVDALRHIAGTQGVDGGSGYWEDEGGDDDGGDGGAGRRGGEGANVVSWKQLQTIPGIGRKTLEAMRAGISV